MGRVRRPRKYVKQRKQMKNEGKDAQIGERKQEIIFSEGGRSWRWRMHVEEHKNARSR
jgi:hypothetical protein